MPPTAGSAFAPRQIAAAGVIPRRQRHSGFQALELDTGTRPGPQQAVRGLPQRRTALHRILGQRGIERGKKRSDVTLDAVAQLAIDKRTTIFFTMHVIAVPLSVLPGGG